MPALRSIHRRKKARLTAGIAKIFAAEAVTVPQTRIGMRLIDMPGARSRRNVTTKLIDPTVVEMPSRIIPERIEIDVGAGIVCACGIRNVIEPAVIGSETQAECGVEENSGAQVDPVGQRVEPRQAPCRARRAAAARDNC